MTNLTPEQRIDEIIEIFADVLATAHNYYEVAEAIKQAKQQLLSLIQEEKIKELKELRNTASKHNYTWTSYTEKVIKVDEWVDYLTDRLQALKQESKNE